MKHLNYILILLLLLTIFAIDIHFSSSYEEYSMYNSNWNGTSLFVNDAVSKGAVLTEDYSILSGVTNSTLILIQPDGDFSPDELRALRDYKNRGNQIFISDEAGQSKDLLKILGTDLSVEKASLLSVDLEYNNPGFIISYSSGDDNISYEIKNIALNKPSVAQGGKSVISTSFISWIDENKNEKADISESIGKRAVLVKSNNVYLLSDSGIFQNALYKDENLKDNRKFISNLLENRGTVYLDGIHSKIASEDGVLKYLNILRKNEMLKAVSIIIIILLLLFICGVRDDRERV
ncbi:MAG: DUF4350 domain-containing protein [Methanomicrobium sp.]|nr:DUF4350 domain-containing protein [Methanomicrobium sp.]